MNISEMTEEQKTIALARIVGLEVMKRPDEFFVVIPDEWERGWVSNFYSEENSPIAWRVLNWASRGNNAMRRGMIGLFRLTEGGDLWAMPLHKAQAKWLDKILELAIESGMVTG